MDAQYVKHNNGQPILQEVTNKSVTLLCGHVVEINGRNNAYVYLFLAFLTEGMRLA